MQGVGERDIWGLVGAGTNKNITMETFWAWDKTDANKG